MKLRHTEVKFYPEVKSQTSLSSLRVSCKRARKYCKYKIRSSLSQSHQILWCSGFCKVTWNVLAALSPLPHSIWPHSIWPLHLARWSTTLWWSLHLKFQLINTQLFKHVVTWGHMIKTFFISATTIPTATNPGKVVTYNEEVPSIKSHDPLITWSSVLISLIRFVGLERKRLSRHRFLFYVFETWSTRNGFFWFWEVWHGVS